MAVNWNTPTPTTIHVVQIEPKPIPILIQSAPASIKDLVASFVATFPAIICVVFESFFYSFNNLWNLGGMSMSCINNKKINTSIY
jgi:hypothetical protein